jgi:cyclic pyranopterin phosphate synthase
VTEADERAGSKAGAGTSLTHLEQGPDGPRARMVDVGAKPASDRAALARARLRFPAGVHAAALEGAGAKGPFEEIARAAGILAAKRTGELIPMCHPLGLDHVEIVFTRPETDVLEIRCRTRCPGRSGVEMEALSGAAVAALTVYDMTKALDHGIVIERVELLEKSGGKSGVWHA